MGTFPPSNPPSGGANSTIQVPEPSAPPRSVIIAPPPTMAEAAEIVRRLSQPQLPMVPLLPSYGLHHRPFETARPRYPDSLGLTRTDMMITRNQWTCPNGNSNTAPISVRRAPKSRQNRTKRDHLSGRTRSAITRTSRTKGFKIQICC